MEIIALIIAISTVLVGVATILQFLEYRRRRRDSRDTIQQTEANLLVLSSTTGRKSSLDQAKITSGTTERLDLAQLRRLLINHFTNDELAMLCADLDVDIETISRNQSTKELRALDVADYFRRQGRLKDLVSQCVRLRPAAPWEDVKVQVDIGIQAPLPTSIGDSSITKPGEPLKLTNFHYEKLLDKLKTYVGSSAYDRAVLIGEQELEPSIFGLEKSDGEVDGELCECLVWFAHALIYVGNTDRAVKTLNKVLKLETENWVHEQICSDSTARVLWNRVFGKAHNHLGYVKWMNRGEYQTALYEFARALPHFAEERSLSDELATAYDNMGRIFTQLGYRSSAESLIGEGMRLRKGSDRYRYALSLNSQAICRMTFGQINEAILLADEALSEFEKQVGKHGTRGVGLALLTKGKALRYECASQRLLHGYAQSIDLDSRQRAISSLVQAKIVLDKALAVFVEIGEEVRIVEALNELGCVQRDLMQLEGGHERKVTEILRESMERADGKYPVLFVDACEDLAQTYLAIRSSSDAEKAIEVAENAIPGSYKLDHGTGQVNNSHSENEVLVEEYWQQLGKIYLLKGHIKLLNLHMPTGYPNRALPKALEDALQAYAQASGYFDVFLSRLSQVGGGPKSQLLFPAYRPALANHHWYRHQIYDKLHELDKQEIEHIRLALLPGLVANVMKARPDVAVTLLQEVIDLLFLVKSGIEDP